MATKTTAKTAKTTTKTKTTQTKPKTVAATRTPREVIVPEDYEPIGMWGYFGYQLLFAIPLIGWVLCVMFALTARNYNLRNFARSQFCYLIIAIVLFCLLAGLGVLNTVIDALMNQ